MSQSRRTFLRKAGMLAGAAGLSPLIGSAMRPAEYPFSDEPGRSPIPDDEFSWEWVRSQYASSPILVNMNNGVVSPSPKPVEEAFIRLTQTANQNPSQFLNRTLGDGILIVKKKLAAMLNCTSDELAMSRNATEALDTAICGISLQKGDEVILSRYDYPRMLHAWRAREKKEGIVLKWVDFDFPEDNKKTIIEKYTSLFTSRTRLVHITHMINWVGQVLPAKEIAAAAKEKNILVVLDAAHTLAHIPVDVKEIQCDYMGASLHKWLCAPTGNGILYMRKERIAETPPIFAADEYMHDSMEKFEQMGTTNIPAQLAVAHAVDFHNLIGSRRKQERLYFLKKYWTDKVKKHPKVKIYAPESSELSGSIALFSIEGKGGQEIASFLQQNYHIHTNTITFEKLNGVRVSPNIYISTEELDWLAEGVLELAGK